MKITTIYKQTPTELFNDSVIISNTPDGIMLREKRSSSADKRIKIHSVEIQAHELIKSFKVKAKGKVPVWLINLAATVIYKVIR